MYSEDARHASPYTDDCTHVVLPYPARTLYPIVSRRENPRMARTAITWRSHDAPRPQPTTRKRTELAINVLPRQAHHPSYIGPQMQHVLSPCPHASHSLLATLSTSTCIGAVPEPCRSALPMDSSPTPSCHYWPPPPPPRLIASSCPAAAACARCARCRSPWRRTRQACDAS